MASYAGRVEKDAFGNKTPLKPKFLRFSLSPKQCTDVADFYNAFSAVGWDKKTPLDVVRARPKSRVLQVGFGLDPYAMYRRRLKNPSAPLGGGCSSFGVSFLKIIGRFDPIFERLWTREMIVSERLVGGEFSRVDPKREISVKDIVFDHEGGKWQHRGWDSRRIRFYDVEKIWDFIDGAHNCAHYLNGKLPQKRLPKNCSPEILAWVKKKGRSVVSQYTFEAEAYDAVPSSNGSKVQWSPRPVHVTREGLNLN